MRKVTRTVLEDEDDDMVRKKIFLSVEREYGRQTYRTRRIIASLSLFQQVAHSTCGDSEYNLRSRTVVCGSCGLPSDKTGNCSVSSASRSFRSGGVSEGLLPHSYVFSASTPRKVAETESTHS